MRPLRKKPNWQASIEGLRGLAVVLVFISHVLGHWLSLSSTDQGPLVDVYRLVFQIDFGRLGVYIFFLISGFLIPSSIKGYGAPVAQDFIRRRFFRIAPLYFFSVPLGLVLEHWLQGRQISLAMTVQNVFLIPNFFGNPYSLNAYWTLQIELFFYVIVFFVALRLDFIRSKHVISSALITTILLAELVRPDHHSVGPALSTALGELAKVLGGVTFIWIGALLRKWADQQLSKLDRILLALYVTYALVYTPLRHIKHVSWNADFPTLSFLVPGLALLTFLAVLRQGTVCRALGHIGTVSYSMYLLHAPVIYVIKHFFSLTLGFLGIGRFDESQLMLSTVMGLGFIAITFLLSLWVSHWSYEQVERRFWAPTTHGKTIPLATSDS